MRWRVTGLLVLLGLAAGCGGPKVGRVTGRVTVDGRPVPAGRVTFFPADGRPGTGPIAADGTYTLTTFDPGDGALVGEHAVVIEATRVTESKMEGPKTLEEEIEFSRRKVNKVLVPGEVVWLAPEKYSRAETSGLRATVNAGDNTLDFDLPAKP